MTAPANTTLVAQLAALETTLAALTVSDLVWPKTRTFTVLGLVDGGPGILPDTAENLGILVSVPETKNKDNIGGAAQVWVDDAITVTLFYRMPDGVDKRRGRDEALTREDEIRVAVTSQGQDEVHTRRKWLDSRRSLSSDRGYFIIAQRFKFDRYDAIGGS